MSTKRFPMEGLEVWKNEKNGFTVFQLHYSANPEKANPDWKAKNAKAMTRAQWNQEYEISWDSFEGQPVYGDWIKKKHGSPERIYPEIGLPLLCGWDFGLTPACVIGQLQKRKLVVFKEFVASNMGIKRFLEEVVVPGRRLLFPQWSEEGRDWLHFIDPAGDGRKDTDESTCAQVMYEVLGRRARITPGAVAWEARRSAVEHFLTTFDKDGPNFQIDIAGCPTLVRGFDGGYRYPDSVLELEPNKIRPLKDMHSHPHDALQYLASQVRMMQSRPATAIPTPGYSWSGSS